MRWIWLGLVAALAWLGYMVFAPTRGDNPATASSIASGASGVAPGQSGVIAAGSSYLLAIDRNGRVFGWGSARGGNERMQPFSTTGRPRVLLQGDGYRQVSAGDSAIYALHAGGTLWRWGLEDVLAAVAANTLARPLPVAPDQRWKLASETWGVGVAIRADGSLWYWQDEELEDQARQQPVALVPRTPHRLMPGTRFVDACLQGARLHAVDEAGQLWRTADLHRTGGGTGPLQGERSDMQPLPAQGRLVRVYCRENAGQVLALDEAGRLHGYGYDSFGELGVGKPENGAAADAAQAGPLQSLPGGPWTMAAVSHSYSLAVARDGTLWGWGRNMSNELGLGDDDTSSYHVPTLVDDRRRWVAVAATTYGTGLALAENGELYAWGSNGGSALGDGGVASSHDRPTAVLTDERFGGTP